MKAKLLLRAMIAALLLVSMNPGTAIAGGKQKSPKYCLKFPNSTGCTVQI